MTKVAIDAVKNKKIGNYREFRLFGVLQIILARYVSNSEEEYELS